MKNTKIINTTVISTWQREDCVVFCFHNIFFSFLQSNLTAILQFDSVSRINLIGKRLKCYCQLFLFFNAHSLQLSWFLIIIIIIDGSSPLLLFLTSADDISNRQHASRTMLKVEKKDFFRSLSANNLAAYFLILDYSTPRRRPTLSNNKLY